MNTKNIEMLDDDSLAAISGGAISTTPGDWLPFPITPPVPAPMDDFCGTPPNGRGGRPLGSL